MQPDQINKLYSETPPDQIPWNKEDPPPELVALVESGRVHPCKAIDFGCGLGNYVIWLAQRGFTMTGVDLSAVAIAKATEHALSLGVQADFIAADMLGDLHQIFGTFDFAYDWGLLHHIMPDDRPAYVRNVVTKLKSGAPYMSVCFSEEDPQFGGEGKFRTSRLGTEIYFSSESEIRALFEPHFTIEDLKTIDLRGRNIEHRGVYVLMHKP